MNVRCLVPLLLILTIGLLAQPVLGAWSIADPNDPANADLIAWAEKQGYWNFQYDENSPRISAGLYCCWWERWYNKYEKKGVSTESASEIADELSSDSVKSVETEAYCPSCCDTCDEYTRPGIDPDLQARSDIMMAKKPWLEESGIDDNGEEETTNTANTASPKVASMTFGDAE